MNPEELMLGDYVHPDHNDKTIVRVDDVNDKVIHFILPENKRDITGGHAGWHFADHIEPIKLTPEILEKIGFEKYGKPHFNLQQWVIKAGERNVSIVQEFTREGWCFKDIWITYVHELQNLLRICKIDLQIVL